MILNIHLIPHPHAGCLSGVTRIYPSLRLSMLCNMIQITLRTAEVKKNKNPSTCILSEALKMCMCSEGMLLHVPPHMHLYIGKAQEAKRETERLSLQPSL